MTATDQTTAPATTAPLGFTTTHTDLHRALSDLRPFLASRSLDRSRPGARAVTFTQASGRVVRASVYDVVVHAAVEFTATQLVEGAPVSIPLDDLIGLTTTAGKTGNAKAVGPTEVRVAPAGEEGPDGSVLVSLAASGVERQIIDRTEPLAVAPDPAEITWRGPLRETRSALEATALAAGRDETLPMLALVALYADEEKGGCLVASATDRYRMAVTRTGPLCPHDDAQLAHQGDPVLFPVEALTRALKRLGKGFDYVGLGVRPGGSPWGAMPWCSITDGRVTVSTAAYDGQAPNYAGAWTILPGASAVLDRAALREVVERGMKVAPKPSGARTDRAKVTLRMRPGQVEIEMRPYSASDDAVFAAAVLPATVEADDESPERLVVFNGSYLHDALAFDTAEYVALVAPRGTWRRVAPASGGGWERKGPGVGIVASLEEYAEERPARAMRLMTIGKVEHKAEKPAGA